MGFARIFLRRIMHSFQRGLTVHSVAINNNFGVEAMQIAFACDDQRINFQQRQIALFEQFCQA